MKIKTIIIAALLLTVSTLVSAQSKKLEAQKEEIEKAEMLVPRAHFRPSHSLEGIPGIDTLDTVTPGLKIILYVNNTWGYWRDPASYMDGTLFTSDWSDVWVDPFHKQLSDLPERLTMWLVDDISQFKCPYVNKVYSPFGYRHRRRHQGVDLPLKTGDPIYAAFEGKVRISKYVKGYGNLVVIRHTNGLETFYGHLSSRKVDVGDWVDSGHVIGLGGSTGRSTGPHLHFETRYQGYAFDPQWLIDFEHGQLRSQLFILKKKYLNANSKYVMQEDEEEDDIIAGDTKDYADAREKHVADSIAAAKAAAEAAAARYVTVKSGDTLGRIAIRNHTTVSAICRLNKGLTPKTVLRIGRKIRVK